jgi:TraM recognition site of TraD and TraG
MKFPWRKPPEPLAATLWSWTKHDRMTVRDLLNGGLCVFGRSGSGKTSSSGKMIGRSIVRHRNSGGLILAAKPEDKLMWQGIFEETGRAGDLLVFEPDGKLRFSFTDFEMQHGGHTRNIVRCLLTLGETLRSSDNKGGGEDSDFFERQNERLLYDAVEIVKLATGKVDSWDLHRFITGSATSAQQLASEEWRAGFHNQCLKTAFERPKKPIEQHDCQLAMEYWLSEYPNMADKTRSSILAGVMGILHIFNTGVVRELVSTTTNVTPEVMANGKWLLVNMPPAEWGDIGNFVNAGWKFLTQRWNLRRVTKDTDCINVIWCDEASQFLSSMDGHYLAQCRSHLGCMVFLTQSKHSFYAALKGQSGRHQADALLSNFSAKVFHALGDVETAEWASSLIGRDLQTFIGGSMAPLTDFWDEIMGRSRFTGNFNQHIEAIVQPGVFLNGLRTGGRTNRMTCDAIVIKSGDPFSCAQNWLQVAFSQQ